jgi:hypothetical protein
VEDLHTLSALLIAAMDKLWAWLLTSGLRVILILAVSCGLLRAVRLFTQKLSDMLRGFTQSVERQKRATTLSHIVRVVATTVLVVVTTMLILHGGVKHGNEHNITAQEVV